MAPRGAARLEIVHAAERLFAERGIEAVSLRDVNLAAGQKNHSAAQYHFGDRAGLIAAVFEARMDAINEDRHRLLAELDPGDPLAALVHALVAPLVDAVAATPSWYGRFLARARWDTLAAEVLAEHPAASSVREANRRLQRELAEMPSDLRHGRIDQLHTLLVGSIAGWEWARDRHEAHLLPGVLAADLTATGVAVLSAPLPTATGRTASH
jgi:AcrR family transcriptional regulator